MPWIEITQKRFPLGTRLTRMFAFCVDVFCVFLGEGLLFNIFPIFNSFILGPLSFALCIFGLLCMDGIMGGRGIGKRLFALQVVRLKDGEPCSIKESILRRVTTIFQPFDILFAFGKNKQRMGDKLANTVVIHYSKQYSKDYNRKPRKTVGAKETALDKVILEFSDLFSEVRQKFYAYLGIEKHFGDATDDSEAVLEQAILDISNRLSEAQQKVYASVEIERQFQEAYRDAMEQAQRCEERATLAIKGEQKDLARKNIAERNEYLQQAYKYKEQWDDQKDVVTELKTLLETLKRKTEEAERKRDIVIAKNTNIDAHQHLQETLSEVQEMDAFDIVEQMEQEVSEAASIAEAASAVESDLRDPEISREHATVAEEGLIEKDLEELKSKIESEGL